MKIGILTIHNAKNFGAVLQAYALQHSVGSEFEDVKVINYNNPHISSSLNIVRPARSISSIRRTVLDIIEFRSRQKACKEFKTFINKYLKVTTPFHKGEKPEEEFDIYLLGSDQVWNPNCISSTSTLDSTYFFDFAPKHSLKASYAASAGAHIFTEQEATKVRSLLHDFKHIGVRELELKRQIEKSFNLKASEVLDPTLLLTSEEWSQKFDLEQKNDQPYMVSYFVNRKNSFYNDILVRISKKLELPIISISPGILPDRSASKVYKDAGPLDFMRLIKNSSYVVTDSFHGVAFSLIFKVPFSVTSPGKSVIRIENLLSKLGLQERVIHPESHQDFIQTNISYSEASIKLDQERFKSKQFLSSILAAQPNNK
ncbi:polysaccharide pyruvyl transferase family protein [Pseudomonas sp. JH-2]|uniref:polysaccharide pyruvyl transferase family protein n=1 Tax=Pseudomonas sp. JH-2 TaxID=3114998 RepID=UPI002E276F16|nr:polysaccharide pyruvyl transferase family protein [Pseudomonas sp. JH-2]